MSAAPDPGAGHGWMGAPSPSPASAPDADRPPPTVWPAARRSVAVLAVVCSLATSGLGAATGTGAWAVLAAVAHVLAAVWALADTRMIGAQVGTGVLLAWALLPDAEGAGVAALVVAVVAGVVATSELLGACARLGMVIERVPGPEMQRVGLAVAVSVVVSTATVAAAGLAGPTNLVATGVAALGCVVVAVAARASSSGEADRSGDVDGSTGAVRQR